MPSRRLLLRPLPAAGAFDAVACCFFLDTAHNVLEYLEVIWHCLRPGGYFVNLGPLLYHWADAPGEELSVELSLEEVKAAAAQVGLIPAWAKAAGWAARVQGSGVGSKGAGQRGGQQGGRAAEADQTLARHIAPSLAKACCLLLCVQVGFKLLRDEMVPAAFLRNERSASAWVLPARAIGL